jgi:hypothetical protein
MLLAQPQEVPIHLRLPTENDYLFRGQPEKFFAPTVSNRLISGMYGFTRSSTEPPRIFDRFHEGIDIRPLRRDRRGEPLDPVLAVADGFVAHSTDDPTKSNYGHYVVLRHEFGGYEIYTLYAHNAKNTVVSGQRVRAGDQIAVIGYTGSGINRECAHLHFEVAFLLNRNFESWFELRGKKRPDDKNHHGTMNGINLLGIDPVPLLRASRAGRPLTIQQVFALQEPCYKVCLPASERPFDFQKRFDFLTEGGLSQPRPVSWVVTCNQVGLPLKFEPRSEPCYTPRAVWFDYSRSIQNSMTIGRVQRRSKNSGPLLLPPGQSYFEMLIWRP